MKLHSHVRCGLTYGAADRESGYLQVVCLIVVTVVIFLVNYSRTKTITTVKLCTV